MLANSKLRNVRSGSTENSLMSLKFVQSFSVFLLPFSWRAAYSYFFFCLVRFIFLYPFTYSCAESGRPERGINHWFGWLHCACCIRPGMCESDPAQPLYTVKNAQRFSCVLLSRLGMSCESFRVASNLMQVMLTAWLHLVVWQLCHHRALHVELFE